MHNKIREVRFKPYLAGLAWFKLELFATNIPDRRNDNCLVGYRLWQYYRGNPTLIFEGDEFSPSPLHAADSDESVACLMSFLTLRPGDTDREYFDAYTPEQLEFAVSHGEALALEVMYRFGEV